MHIDNKCIKGYPIGNKIKIQLLKGSSFYSKVVNPRVYELSALLATIPLLARPLPVMVEVFFDGLYQSMVEAIFVLHIKLEGVF
ncbi:hypothetical protein ACJROX_08500 [Pseudalkalibacillus sp. A8]|uniref:hypothetical protein n=1 Tax=Pseudalkalibacillus sp. A8 TaxID=3382641 RepID=UPI0038B5EF96